MTNPEVNDPGKPAFYHFGEFRLDAKRNMLTRSGKPVSLAYKAFQTLLVLVENQGCIVKKEEILHRVWQDTFVEENSLARNISVLRKILGEEPNSKLFIETVPRRGYRFIAPVTKTGDGIVLPVEGTSEQSPEVQEKLGMPPAASEISVFSRENVFNSETGEVYRPVPPESKKPVERSSSGKQVTADKFQNDPSAMPGKPGVRMFLVILLILIGFGALTFFVWYGSSSSSNNAAKTAFAPGQNLTVTRFTNIGKALDAALARDGKYVAYVADEGGKQSLWIRQSTADGIPLELLPPAEVSFQGLAFSSDGNYLYYNIWDRRGVGEIFRIPALGGMPAKIIHDCLPAIAVSPLDGKIAFLRGYDEKNEQGLLIANADGSGERLLAKLGNKEWVSDPAWSPDGKKLAVGFGRSYVEENSDIQIYELPIETGQLKLLSDKQWVGINGIAWMPDQRGLIVNGVDRTQKNTQIWQIDLPGGEARKITSEATGYNGISIIAADGKTLVSVQQNRDYNIWVASGAHPEEGKKITDGRNEGRGADWMPDGRIVYTSLLGSKPDIWITDADGNNKKQLTGDRFIAVDPVVSPADGSIYFLSNRSNSIQIWRMDANGQNVKQITDDFTGRRFSVSPDGKWLVYVKNSDGNASNIWKMPLGGGGEPQRLTTLNSYSPEISPDGKLIAYSLWDKDHTPPQWKREIISIEDGHPVKTFTLPDSANLSDGDIQMRWLPDQSGIAYIDFRDNIPNVRIHPLDDKKPEYPLTDFKDGRLYQFNWSPDGKNILFIRGNELSDVVMIKIQ